MLDFFALADRAIVALAAWAGRRPRRR
jgi:hypothetical protein